MRAALVEDAQVGYTPTLIVGYGGLWGENYWYAKTNVWEDERLLTFVPRRVIDSRSRRRTLAPDEEWNHFSNARAGARSSTTPASRVQLGAHGQREGLGAHWELWMFVQGGMTPLQALRAATLNGAHYLGMDKDIGSLETGQARRPARARRQPARQHPQHRVDPLHDRQRPHLRRRRR